MTDRIDPPFSADERTMLDTWLDYHRATLELKCEGLTDDQLRERSVPPSKMSLLGLVRHMAEVERNWFRRVLLGEKAPPRFYSKERPDDDFDDLESDTVADTLAFWRDECEYARKAAASKELDDLAAARRHGDDVTLRWILVHMIEEYARHNGHADLLRERIDGATGD
jgi:uncharacterized damage-inducible protein DinB